MTTTLASLLRSVLENPQDDDVRLILADWLDDNGEAWRAEFIREQIRTGEVRDDWNVGAALIVTTGVADSLGLLGVGAAAVRRGFIHTVTMPLAEWLKHGPDVVACHPVEAVVLADKKPRPCERGGFVWLKDREGTHEHPDRLHPCLWDLVANPGGLLVVRFFEHEADALSALGTAAVNWARVAADLPPLPPKES